MTPADSFLWSKELVEKAAVCPNRVHFQCSVSIDRVQLNEKLKDNDNCTFKWNQTLQNHINHGPLLFLSWVSNCPFMDNATDNSPMFMV